MKEKELTNDQLAELKRIGDYHSPSTYGPHAPALPDGWRWDPELEAAYMSEPAVFIYADPDKLLAARVDIVERAYKVAAAFRAMLCKEKEEEPRR